VEFIRPNIDLERLAAADVSVLLWIRSTASGAGWMPRLLAGGRIHVTEIHSERNPYFGGVNPEPIPPNVDEALATLAGGGYDLGLLLDGDADRSAWRRARHVHHHAPDLRPAHVLPGRASGPSKAPVVKTVNETSMAERLGERYGVAVTKCRSASSTSAPR
jgi:phosphomannomutase